MKICRKWKIKRRIARVDKLYRCYVEYYYTYSAKAGDIHPECENYKFYKENELRYSRLAELKNRHLNRLYSLLEHGKKFAISE